MERHRQDAGEAQRATAMEVAGKAAQQIAHCPGEQRRHHQQRHRPRQSAPDQDRDRRGKSRQRRPEIADEDPPPERCVLLGETALEPVQLLERLPHHRDRLGAGAAVLRGGGDRLLDRIDRRGVGDDEGDVDADEDDQRELAKARQQVDEIA
jgi:hypothetical protein